jgi:four helix bundle protein
MKSYEELIVWQKALKIAGEIHEMIKMFPFVEKETLGKQMSRAAISVVSNIAEGRHRKGRQEYAHFVNIAYASGKELDSQVRLSAEFKCISRAKEKDLLEKLDEIFRMLWVLRKRLS